jgi:hypothetical protein
MSLSYYLAKKNKSVAIFELVNKVEAITAELAAYKKDAERLDFLDRASHRCFGWRVLVAPAGNVSVQSVIFLGEGNPPVSIRAAIDAAIAAQEPK